MKSFYEILTLCEVQIFYNDPGPLGPSKEKVHQIQRNICICEQDGYVLQSRMNTDGSLWKS